jgi:hypothetical protein
MVEDFEQKAERFFGISHEVKELPREVGNG